MGATELDEVQELLEHLLPDPAGYAQRLAVQFMTRWGQSARPDATAFHTPADPQNATLGDIVITPEPPEADGTPIDMTMLLAAALGSCECWGLRPDCARCGGCGSAGWSQPDPDLFDEFVKPAMAKLSGVQAVDTERRSNSNSSKYRDNRHTVQGECA